MTDNEARLRREVVTMLRDVSSQTLDLAQRAEEAEGIVSARRLRGLADKLNKIAELQVALRASLLEE